MRDSQRSVEDSVLAALRACPPTQLVSLVLSASSSRGRPSIVYALRNQAGGEHCPIALAVTRGVAVRLVDGIVSGSVEDVVAFLTATAPVLARCHGRAELAAA
jgi:hypothetical protein